MARDPALDRQALAALPPGDDDRPADVRYRSLGDDAAPPSGLTAHHRLARRQHDEDEGTDRLHLVLVTGYDPEADRLYCVAYVSRLERGDAVWGLERWSSPAGTLSLYRRDPAFEAADSAGLHATYRERGAAWLAEQAERILAEAG
jgi:hypothetical protein